ncbi:murein hydrolase activator EnvC family protein [Rhodothermus profundi]|uniref:Septal ring factor EnvC, activator of murein hydrolases AmiA and AmiB n=1 Tax=Rhodothermus profundi TaxID=633813 RepID=A0A1M6WT11_9BACT|nr:peptidoglycan DD-metalloendopeptidase family protein [Rhodothermus profundi]SHK96848.1 Septal ring factor EnvC, activator of murein hydrolases AmiA and AmiB [Rhodothermus profundi]
MRRLLLWLLVMLPALPVLAQHTQDRTEIERRLQRLREQIRQEEARLAETAEAEQATLQTLERIERQIAIRRELIRSYRQRLQELARRIDSLQQAAQALSQEIDHLKAQYRRRALHAYKYGRMHDLALLLSAQSINQMLIRARYLSRFARQREAKLKAIQQATAALEARRQELLAARQETEQLLQEAETERRRLARLERERRRVIKALRAQRVSLEQSLAQKRRAARELESRIQALLAAERERQRAREASDPAAAVAFAELTGSFEQNRGRLPWPAEGAIVEPFGEVVNPVYGTRTPNPGILIATAPQAEVRAVFDGRVIAIDAMPEYGTYILIQHGEYQTFYSNLSLVYVSIGQEVRAGQIIGRAGTEAEPKRAGVFFSLFRGGEVLNPMPWLRPR